MGVRSTARRAGFVAAMLRLSGLHVRLATRGVSAPRQRRGGAGVENRVHPSRYTNAWISKVSALHATSMSQNHFQLQVYSPVAMAATTEGAKTPE